MTTTTQTPFQAFAAKTHAFHPAVALPLVALGAWLLAPALVIGNAGTPKGDQAQPVSGAGPAAPANTLPPAGSYRIASATPANPVANDGPSDGYFGGPAPRNGNGAFDGGGGGGGGDSGGGSGGGNSSRQKSHGQKDAALSPATAAASKSEAKTEHNLSGAPDAAKTEHHFPGAPQPEAARPATPPLAGMPRVAMLPRAEPMPAGAPRVAAPPMAIMPTVPPPQAVIVQQRPAPFFAPFPLHIFRLPMPMMRVPARGMMVMRGGGGGGGHHH
jgi:hypothetical protein